MALSIAFSLLSLLLPVGLVVLVVLVVRRRGVAAGPGGGARGVRRFFQYLLLFALTVVAAIGVSDLLGRLFGAAAAGGETLARTLAFTLVGVPLAILIALWTRRSLQDPEEGRSLGYGFYLTLAALTALVVAMVALQGALSALLTGDLDGGALATLLVWGGLWFLHWTLARRTPQQWEWPHLLLGSLAGLGTAVVALALLLGASLEALLLDGGGMLVLGTGSRLAEFGATFVVGALVWVRYWVTAGARLPRTAPWLVHVLPIGVGGGLLTAIVAASILLWQVLVWFLGDPFAAGPREHFSDAPTAFGFVVAGLLSWWYHRAVLAESREARTEVRRVHEYLVSAIGLLAAAAGVGMVVVAAVESFTPGLDIGVSTLNTLLGALTLLAVGVPVWWWFWGRVRAALAADPVAEVASPTRRTYLVLLFGIAGVAAVVALIVAVFVLLQDVLAGTSSGETLRSMRYALGVLLATAAVSAYHGAVYREDRAVSVPARPEGPRSVVLVGAPAPGLDRALAHATGARVDLWVRTDAAAPPWSEDALLAVLAGHAGEDLLVLAEGGDLRVVVVSQGRTPDR